VLKFYSHTHTHTHTHTHIFCQFLASFRMDYINGMCNNIRKAIKVTKRYSDNVYLSYTLQCFIMSIASCLYWLENINEDFVKCFSFNTCICIRDPGLSRKCINGKFLVPWDVTRCNLLGFFRRFGGIYCPSTLKMDAVGVFEMLVNFYSIDG